MNIFLDDDRNPQEVKWVELPPVSWTTARNYNEFVRAISSTDEQLRRVSFDHDLCREHYVEYHDMHDMSLIRERRFRYEAMKEKTGYHALRWLLDRCAERKLVRPLMWFHTWNPEGKVNMEGLVTAFDVAHPDLVPSS